MNKNIVQAYHCFNSGG